jgi:hypothetical protein
MLDNLLAQQTPRRPNRKNPAADPPEVRNSRKRSKSSSSAATSSEQQEVYERLARRRLQVQIDDAVNGPLVLGLGS